MNKRLISLSFSLRSSVQLHRPPLYHSISILFYSSSKPKRSKFNSVFKDGRSKSTPKVAVAEYLINQHQFSPEAALKASSSYAFLKNTAETDSVLSFLKESGFSKTQLEEVVKRIPWILRANLDTTIKPKIKIFQDSGFSDSDIADVISSDPWILWQSADNRLGPAILGLKNILGSNAGVLKVLKLCGWYLKYDLEKTVIPNIEVLKSLGISSSQIVKYICHFPRFYLHTQENIMDFVRRVDEMGFDRKSKLFLSAIRTISSMSLETWEMKVKLFQSLGFSEKGVLEAFRRAPQVFCISEKKIKEATEIMLSSGKADIAFIVSHPELLICSVDHRLKPRLQVMENLEKKNLLRKIPSLTTICKYTDQKFAERFVIPYANELEV
ncbi:PREDICTED: uncharacterized protein LOC103319853 [Prunus mume]|uniref:Uncharacterized protein LOC103319853 n=1 Tax=Prunus mume TaxID=102107 RepID=A0ABM0N546_PRUMU|nr:PREDICTED: uncharacterized protein LOC103319853 [Prunus mume]